MNGRLVARFSLPNTPLLAALMLLASVPAAGQPMATSAPALADESIQRLVGAAHDSSLPFWQRDFMLRLARTAGADGPGRQVQQRAEAGGKSLSPGVPPGAVSIDAVWDEPIIAARKGQAAIYDPVRGRMLVFGG